MADARQQGDSRAVFCWCSIHILVSSVISSWTSARLYGICLFYTIKKQTLMTSSLRLSSIRSYLLTYLILLKCLWNENFFVLIWKAFPNAEEWRFSFWNIYFRFTDDEVGTKKVANKAIAEPCFADVLYTVSSVISSWTSARLHGICLFYTIKTLMTSSLRLSSIRSYLLT